MDRVAARVPEGMPVVHGCFPRWRKPHSGRLPIPESRRRAANELAKDHGVWRTAEVLRLEYGKLKRLTNELHPDRQGWV